MLGHTPVALEKIQLQQFASHLLSWNQQYNLIGPAAVTSLLDRHILDSLTLLPFLTTPAKIADMGSGAGFPGMILAIMSDSSRQFHLYESSQKKARFLNFIVTELQLKDRVTIQCQRIESPSQQTGSYDFVTSRALGDLQLIAKLSRHLLHPNGISLALKGRSVHEELSRLMASSEARHFHAPKLFPSPGNGDGVIIQMQKVSRETSGSKR
ncbi:MAG: 16S rRNA (guanine(527)-N(7))-methyltransferase RsmG [Magnetococcus sp. YQC-5]